MSATIMMPAALELSIKSMCDDAVAQAVAILAEKHGFDSENAMRDVNATPIKLVRKRGPSPKSEKKLGEKTKKVDDKPKTKRAPSGYNLFMKATRPLAKKDLEEVAAGAKVAPSEVMTELGARWKALIQADRDTWNQTAKDAKEIASSTASSLVSSVVVSEDEEQPEIEIDGELAIEIETDDELLEELPEEQPEEPIEIDPKVIKAKAKAKSDAGYLLYHKQNKATIKSELELLVEEGTKVKSAEVNKESGKRWKAFDTAEKAEWIDMVEA